MSVPFLFCHADFDCLHHPSGPNYHTRHFLRRNIRRRHGGKDLKVVLLLLGIRLRLSSRALEKSWISPVVRFVVNVEEPSADWNC